MNANFTLGLRPFLIGTGAFILIFMAMMMTTSLATSIISALLYLLAGVWIDRIQPQSLWYAPPLMNIFIWGIFIPTGMEIWPLVIHIWYSLIPPLAALAAAYLGLYVSSKLEKPLPE